MSRSRRFKGRPINGCLLLDKPTGLTSNAALQKVKRLYFARKAGHTGSLDPLASGLLPICFAEATKFSQFLLESDKRYEVTAHLGVKTTTGDAEGEVVESAEVKDFSSEEIERVLTDFTGLISQIPSMFSAIKYQGKPLYEYARAGIEIPRESREVSIFSIELLSINLPDLTVHCSKGTYIRTLVEDIGDALGCLAYVSALRRTSVSHYLLENSVTLAQIEEWEAERDHEKLSAQLLSVASSVEAYPEVSLSETLVFYVKQGQPVMVPNLPDADLFRLTNKAGKFLGVGGKNAEGLLIPKRLIA